ncbi:hypothetical protein CVT25_006600 [Psilocybe cyanescens]|uniref:THH1/TOM1/TOM3 domain-containing protein n=1 Tax=Psilocybe cyanescens TaxID=93625 RepID=A0A409XKR4_PSICY|nr:hypothetical protein CVT25_006600 [Psilocybe cyanescens]
MAANTDKINYAKALGFHSVAAAVIFTVLYVPLLGWFVRQSFFRPTYVHFVLVVFCTIRIAAFAIRAVLAGSSTAGETLGLVIADEILFGVGYFGLLYSAYTLVLDLELLCGGPPPRSPILVLVKNRRIFRLAMLVAVVLGVYSASHNNGQGSTSSALHKVSIIIFLVLTVLQAFQTVMLARTEYAGDSQYLQGQKSLGRKHGVMILLAISALLLVREAFSAATMSNSTKQDNEHLWYPLLAVPEILAVILYATPGLVPKRDELPSPQ